MTSVNQILVKAMEGSNVSFPTTKGDRVIVSYDPMEGFIIDINGIVTIYDTLSTKRARDCKFKLKTLIES